MAKISKTHHVTKKGVVKKNPKKTPKKEYLVQVWGGDFDNGTADLGSTPYHYIIKSRTSAEARKKANEVIKEDFEYQVQEMKKMGEWIKPYPKIPYIESIKIYDEDEDFADEMGRYEVE